MAQDLTIAEDPSPWAAETWWAARRLRYNVALLLAGLLAFVLYAVVVEWCIRIESSGDFEITLFTTAFQAVGYLFMMAVANLCYNLGPLSERIVRPARVAAYRKITFRLALLFSVLLPFTIPTILATTCYLHIGEGRPK
jgi:hypothetical protein